MFCIGVFVMMSVVREFYLYGVKCFVFLDDDVNNNGGVDKG